MNFGEMLEILKDGKHRAYRANWNGIKVWQGFNIQSQSRVRPVEEFKKEKGDRFIQIPTKNPPMFIYVVKDRVIPNSEVREPLKSWLDGKDMDITDHIDMRTTDGKISSWYPSQTDMLSEDWNIIEPIPVKFAPKGEGITYVQVPKTQEEIDFVKRAEEALKTIDLNMNPEVLKEIHTQQALDQERLLKPLYDKDPSMFVMQPYAVLREKLKKEKILWIESDTKLKRSMIAVELFGGDYKDSASRYLDLFLQQDDLIIVFGKGLKKEIQNQITDMGLTNKRLLSIEVDLGDIPTIKENIIKQLSEVYKDG